MKLEEVVLRLPEDLKKEISPETCIWLASENRDNYNRCCGCNGLDKTCKFYKPLRYLYTSNNMNRNNLGFKH